MKIILLLISLVVSSVCAHAQVPVSADKLFFDANNHYQTGDYQTAASLYEQIVDQGVHSGNLYYNLGNSYFKLGRLGKAAANYERASRYIPRDEDLFANRLHVQSMVKEVPVQEEQNWALSLLAQGRDALSLNGWFFVNGTLYIIFFIFLTIFLTQEGLKSKKWHFIIYGSLILGIAFSFETAKILDSRSNIPAIVVADEAVVRYSPSYNGSVAFKVHEGLRGSVLREEENWTQFRISKNQKGWVESNSIEVI